MCASIASSVNTRHRLRLAVQFVSVLFRTSGRGSSLLPAWPVTLGLSMASRMDLVLDTIKESAIAGRLLYKVQVSRQDPEGILVGVASEKTTGPDRRRTTRCK